MGHHGIVENYSSIDVNELRRNGAFGHRTIEFPYVGLRVPALSMVRTNYTAVDIQFSKDKRWQSIPVRWTWCYFGGQRPWVECLCGRRVAKLYYAGFCFGCRQCLNLIYESQRRSQNGRRYLRLAKLRARCGGPSLNIGQFPPRPAGMRKRTYSKLKSQAELLESELRKSPRFMKRARIYAWKA
jgi:hypothetical protein